MQKEDIIYFENDYAYILLTKNEIVKKVLFDLDNIEIIKTLKWHLHYRAKDGRYDACANERDKNHEKRKYINMARYIMKTPKNLTIDHINRNTLDNRKSNLRNVPICINNLNKSNNTSGCVGVTWDKAKNKWHVMIRDKNLGRYNSFDDAVKARKQAEKENYFFHLG